MKANMIKLYCMNNLVDTCCRKAVNWVDVTKERDCKKSFDGNSDYLIYCYFLELLFLI